MRYSNSYIQTYKSCPTSTYFKYELGLEKIEEGIESHHLVYGKAFHEALKRIYLGDTLEAAKDAFKEIYPVQLDPEDQAKTQENGLLALDAYVKKWDQEDSKWRVVACEEKESFDYIDEEGFTVVLDLVLENIQYGGIYGLDHKIVGGKKATLSYDFWNRFNPNSQITKYVSYIKSKYGDCSGFYINAIGMRFLKKAYKGEPAGFHPRFERQMFNRNQAQLDKEKADTHYWIDRIEDSRKRNIWGMNTEACTYCVYRPICAAGWNWEEDKELIEIQYQHNGPRVANKKGETNAISG